MMKYTIGKPMLTLLAMFLAVASLNAADESSGTTTACKAATAPGKQSNRTAPGDASTTPALDKKDQHKLKHAHYLAEKTAKNEFLNSQYGIVFKNQIVALEQEINAVYESNLNLFLEDPETGKKLRAERDRQLQLLFQKRGTIEADYEKLRNNSPAYREMVDKHLKSQFSHLRGKMHSKSVLKEERESLEKKDNQ